MNGALRLFGSTMLVERFIGVATYAITLFIFYGKVRKAKNTREINKFLRRYLFVLCVMAFFYIPGENADLFRWRLITNSWGEIPLNSFLTNQLIRSDTPAAYLLMYLCQKTGIRGLLPMICALIFYSNVFHIFSSVAVHYEISSEALAIGLFYFMAPGMLLETISGVRCFVAFAIIARCICDEYIEQRSIVKSIIPYIIACLFHTAALALVAIRLLALLFESKKSLTLIILNVIAMMIMALIAFRYGNNFVDATLAKANSYTSRSTYQYIWEYIIGGIGFIVIAFNIYHAIKNSMGKNINHNIAKLLLILAVFEIVLIRSYSIFHRYIAASTIISIPMIVLMIDKDIAIGRRTKKKNILVMSTIMLFLACARGNLCGYKFFQL